jgi:hypothetical protein
MQRTDSMNSIAKWSQRLALVGKSNDSNISGSKQLINYNESDHRRLWMPDHGGKNCYECECTFTTFRRRHHCRLCGQIFCARCCSLEVDGSALNFVGTLRVCAACAHGVQQALASNAAQLAQMDGSTTGSGSSDVSKVLCTWHKFRGLHAHAGVTAAARTAT